MTPSEVEKAVARGILKGGLLLLLAILVIWLLSPLLFPLLMAWGLYFSDHLTTMSWRNLKEVLVVIGMMVIVIGIPMLMGYKRMWIYSDKIPADGIRFYVALGKALIFHFLLVILGIAFAVYFLN